MSKNCMEIFSFKSSSEIKRFLGQENSASECHTMLNNRAGFHMISPDTHAPSPHLHSCRIEL